MMINKENLFFGIPKQQAVKQDKYKGFPVLVMHKLDNNSEEGKKQNRKFQLNLTAVNLLNFKMDGDDKIDFAFLKDTNKIYITNSTENGFSSSVKLTKSGTFSNSKLYSYIATRLRLDTSVDNTFHIKELPGEPNLFEIEVFDEIGTNVQPSTELKTVEEILN